jgi:hypothetical protein
VDANGTAGVSLDDIKLAAHQQQPADESAIDD